MQFPHLLPVLLEIATLPQPSKEFKSFCNSLRCPLCGSQLDGNIHPKRAQLYCVRDNREYLGIWMLSESVPESEMLVYWYSEYEYEIHISRNWLKGSDVFDISVLRYNSGVNPIYKSRSCKIMFQFSGQRLLFFRQRMEEETFLKKLKTYQVFS